MVTSKLRAIADNLYAVHADMLSFSIAGKDCQRFTETLKRVGDLQAALREVAMDIEAAAEEKKKEVESVKDPE